jgi:hypothetical protein
MPFYPDDAPVPAGLRTDEFVLRMLAATDVELDYDAVMASKDMLHLRSGGSWPRDGFTLAENLADLQGHEADFHARRGFTYTIMNPEETQCLGCLYIYPLGVILHRIGVETAEPEDERVAEASFWVRQERIADDLDKRVLAALLPWLRHDFAFSRLYLRAFAQEQRHVAIFAEAGLRLAASYPARDMRLLLFE